MMWSGGPDKMPSDAEAEIHQRSRGDFAMPVAPKVAAGSSFDAQRGRECAACWVVVFSWLRLGSGLGKTENGEWRAWLRASDVGLDGTSWIHV